MSERSSPQISSRKQPRQARSTELVSAVLQAAVQVLATQGARRFTMARVAERAGVSVGSVYQYFPNKAAILFRLQSDEWRQTCEMLRNILQDNGKLPFERLRTLVQAFIQSECDEALIRVALSDAAPLYRDAPEAQEARASTEQAMGLFMQEVLPTAAAEHRTLAADLITTTLSAGGKQFSATPRSPAEIEKYAQAMADMFCAYLASLEQP
ncbi:UNVERIFIED_ORG: AcrR family transcriptional regulator [Pseudomonas lini]|uniref:TetR family transcriptional regulator n=1 Tax=Pseudomonas viciae TaxID=2505979 RepID=A0A4P7PGE0_9PSED|nr:TetR family transcriptional regulator [Pseudomonas viciae]QBZ89757.1 TetR/AcrR family transcriptional regulator [Pseudomonas viciae]UZE89218.1 TetR family transcriptional regulator [Pseudomonas viciae]WGO96035.1 TetR family transcriptional regulator [Pseudomonas viciae]